MTLKLNNYNKGQGVLVYDPKRNGLKDVDRHGRTSRTKWWAMIETKDDFADYYRWHRTANWYVPNFEGDKLIDEQGFKTKLDGFRWGSHVSIIRGEIPGSGIIAENNGLTQKDKDEIIREYTSKWKHDNGKTVEFEYCLEIRKAIQKDVEFWTVDVFSDELMELRKFYGLKTIRDVNGVKKPYKFHLTVGRRELPHFHD